MKLSRGKLLLSAILATSGIATAQDGTLIIDDGGTLNYNGNSVVSYNTQIESGGVVTFGQNAKATVNEGSTIENAGTINLYYAENAENLGTYTGGTIINNSGTINVEGISDTQTLKITQYGSSGAFWDDITQNLFNFKINNNKTNGLPLYDLSLHEVSSDYISNDLKTYGININAANISVNYTAQTSSGKLIITAGGKLEYIGNTTIYNDIDVEEDGEIVFSKPGTAKSEEGNQISNNGNITLYYNQGNIGAFEGVTINQGESGTINVNTLSEKGWFEYDGSAWSGDFAKLFNFQVIKDNNILNPGAQFTSVNQGDDLKSRLANEFGINVGNTKLTLNLSEKDIYNLNDLVTKSEAGDLLRKIINDIEGDLDTELTISCNLDGNSKDIILKGNKDVTIDTDFRTVNNFSNEGNVRITKNGTFSGGNFIVSGIEHNLTISDDAEIETDANKDATKDKPKMITIDGKMSVGSNASLKFTGFITMVIKGIEMGDQSQIEFERDTELNIGEDNAE